MIVVRLTYAFRDWRDGLRDSRAKAAIARRIDRLASGNPGDTKFLGKGVSELRSILARDTECITCGAGRY